MVTIDPRITKTFVEWADYMYPNLSEFGAIARAFKEDDWQMWGAGLLSLNGIAQTGAPDPYQFKDWKDWAIRFNGALNSGS
jgi:hypothetical protein